MTATPEPAQDPLNAKLQEAAIAAFAAKLERRMYQNGLLPRRWWQPMYLARPVLVLAGGLALGLLSATVSMLLIFIIVNMLLHLG
ncbi:MAG: hypothetical protein ACPGNV_15230 [Mangrovicoccus sp.]